MLNSAYSFLLKAWLATPCIATVDNCLDCCFREGLSEGSFNFPDQPISSFWVHMTSPEQERSSYVWNILKINLPIDFLLTWLLANLFLKTTEKKNMVHPDPIRTGAGQIMVPDTQKQNPTTKWIRAFFILIKILLYQKHKCFQNVLQNSSSWSDTDIHTSRETKRGQGIKIIYLQKPDGLSKVIIILYII